MTFLIICFLCLLVCVLGYSILDNIYKHQSYTDIFRLKDVPKNARFDLVNLGSNHPKYGLDYSNTSIKAMNWAVGPETFKYDFIVLKKMIRHLHKGSYVVIPVCLLNFFLLDYKSKSAYIRYYAWLNKNEMPDYDEEQYNKEYKYPLLRHPKRVKGIVKKLIHKPASDLDHNPMSKLQLEKDAAWWIEQCWDKEFDIDIENMKTLSDVNKKSIEGNVKIMSDMISFCEDNGFIPVVAILPTTKYLRNKFSDDFVQTYIMSNISKAINGRDIKLLNYMNEESLQNVDYYFNSFFMNKRGAKIMGKRLVDDLKKENNQFN